jgi:hypothetical protein
LCLLEKTVRKECVFGKYYLPCTLGAAMGENQSAVCRNSANTFPEAVLKGKDGIVGCKGGQCSVRCCKNPPNWHSVRGVYIIQVKVGTEKAEQGNS